MRIGEINKDNYMQYSKLLSNLTGGKKNANVLPTRQRELTKAEVDAIVRKAQLAHPDGSYGLPGMDITNKNPSEYQKIVDVPDDLREKIIGIARKDFINKYGMTDGEELHAEIRKYLWSIPEGQRNSAAYTLSEVFRDESQRLTDIVKSKMPGWKNGEPFDRSILAGYLSGSIVDTKA